MRVLVTGGAAGIGEAVAARFARDGATVLIADRNADAAERTAARIGADSVAVDLATLDGVRAMMAAASDRLGGLDVLVNNAGGVEPPAYPAAPDEHWLGLLDLNLRSVLLATRLALDLMRDGGAIVNVASSAGLGLAPHGVPEYAVAKAGVIRLTSCLGPLRASHGVAVSCVCPALVDTPASRRDRASMTPEQLAESPEPIPATEIADVVATLAANPELAGRIMVCQAREPRHVLLPEPDWRTYVDLLREPVGLSRR